MNDVLLEKCVCDSFAGRRTFGEIVQGLIADGVEWYSANLIIGCQTFYDPVCAYHSVRWEQPVTGAIADRFDADRVVSAIRASQRREIDYATFLRLIGEAGVVYYTVHLQGCKAVYFGRHGEWHVELFPQT